MKRSTIWLLSAGVLLFAAQIVSHSLSAVYTTLALAGWGLLLVALFHLLPLAIDAQAIRVLLPPSARWWDTVLARWAGESASSLMPFGQLAGPVVTIRQLSRQAVQVQYAAAAITVNTTLQVLAQAIFAVIGLTIITPQMRPNAGNELPIGLLLASTLLAVVAIAFYLAQRRGVFSWSTRALVRISGRHSWRALHGRAEEIDRAVQTTYAHGRGAWASFLLNLAGWIAGTGEVYLILWLFGAQVSWSVALMLEAVGQAVRGAAFAVPGALGVQESGYVLLAPLAGLSADTGLALSLAKRAREIMLAVPGLLYVQASEHLCRRRLPAGAGERID